MFWRHLATISQRFRIFSQRMVMICWWWSYVFHPTEPWSYAPGPCASMVRGLSFSASEANVREGDGIGQNGPCLGRKEPNFNWLVVSSIFFHVIYGMSSFPLTNSYFSRWLLHQPVKIEVGYTNVISDSKTVGNSLSIFFGVVVFVITRQ